MNPSEIIEASKMSFGLLYVDDPARLRALMRQSLTVLEAKGGVFDVVTSPDAEPYDITIPANFGGIVMSSDSEGRYIVANIGDGLLTFPDAALYRPPFSVYYAIKFSSFSIALTYADWAAGVAYVAGDSAVRGSATGGGFICIQSHTSETGQKPVSGTPSDYWAPYNEIQVDAATMLIDHLSLLIGIQNTQEGQAVDKAIGMQTSEFPAVADLTERLKAVEEAMAEGLSVLIPVCARG